MNYEFENIKRNIRDYYRKSYVQQARKQNPVLKQAEEWLGGVGLTLGVLGVVGLVASFIMSAGWPFWAGAAALLLTGIGTGTGADRVGETIDKAAVPLLEADMTNFKLVRSYIKDVLGNEQKGLDNQRKAADEHHVGTHRDIDQKQAALDEKRKAALKLVTQGLDALEGQARDAARDVELFRQEAGQDLGPEFASAVKPAVAAAAGIVRGPSQRIMHS